MKQLKVALAYCLPILVVLLIAFGCEGGNNGTMRLCNHPYALCTSARCVPQPGDPSKAVCFCDVEEGASMATTSCDKLMPSTDANGIGTIYSTFSYKQLTQGKKVMKCPGSTPWTWCLNKRCTVDPANKRRAICLCDVVRTNDEWITFGGSCDTSTCKTAYWSGASMKGFADGNVFMIKKLGLDQSPIKWCQISSQ